MGRNSKARRDAKARNRARQRGGAGAHAGGAAGSADPFGFDRPPGSARTTDSSSAQVLELLARLGDVCSAAYGRPAPVVRSLLQLDHEVVEREVQRSLTHLVSTLWSHGWQPREVARHARVFGAKDLARLLELAVLAEDDAHEGRSVDPFWHEQLRALSMRRHSTRGAWLRAWREREALDPDGALHVVGRAIALLTGMPRLDRLIPPPGQAPTSGARPRRSTAAGASSEILERIRKLLAKAESTEFEAEASAFTAKAQELITRHAIDRAMLDDEGPAAGPAMIRVPIDAPYADAKSYLLQVVAEASRCRSVFSGSVAMSTVVGHLDDLAAVELLYTSLLVQAQHALADAARTAPPGTRVRSTSYRSAFYLAFAGRISERLTTATDEAVRQAGVELGEQTFLPVLRAREEEVREAFEERFGDTLTSSSVRGGWDAAGWDHGRRAGDAAALDSGALTRG